jgi:uncharacterized protein (DUF362 family)
MTETVGIIEQKGKIDYPRNSPFNPPKAYPELQYTKRSELDKTNNTYEAVRDFFRYMEYDKENFGTKDWNPLKNIIKKGDKVVIKPNWVLDVSEYDINALITNMAVVRAVIDYAWIACQPTGQIQVLESPIQSTNWENLMKVTKAKETVDYLQTKGVNIDIQDIRTECFIEKDLLNLFGWRLKLFYRKKLKGTHQGYVNINLKKYSMLTEIQDKAHMFRGIQQMRDSATASAHSKNNHIYSIPKEVIQSDVFINIPKLKTHRKAGVTLTLKNLVGIVNVKDWLPHYVKGTPEQGGDEAPTKKDFISRVGDFLYMISFFKKFGISIRPPGIEKRWRKKVKEDLTQLKNVRQANWYGGDTVWRMVYDLNMILFYADKNGNLSDKKQRNYLGIIDGIIGGEKFGPLNSTPKKTGVIIGGTNPLSLEFIGTRVMGYDENKIKTLKNTPKIKKYKFGAKDFSNVIIKTNNDKWKKIIDAPKEVCFNFEPAPGWKGHIELD